MKCYHCLSEFTPEDARNDNMSPYYVAGMTAVAAVHIECPEAEPVKFSYAVHDDYEIPEMVESLTDQGIPEHIAEKIAALRPFYEVLFECEYNPSSDEVTFTKVWTE